ncbi:MAG: tRNA lysidine(34) synthetase TilS [Vicinamibacterales bacterium]|nr:tRNA lysidine(34) synthetase TilS [Vicinamibacterales bacterium]
MAAVSGGSDSVALFFLLRELAAAGDLRLAGLAHLNHHIRGAAADEDAAFCRALAARAGVAAAIGDVEVPAVAERERLSIEVAGRKARQQFFVEALASLGGQRIGVAHTRDDQAETVLLRLVRGAGPAGLAGIAPRRDHLVRPLLELTRIELCDYLESIGESWREDATNEDRAIARNRIRHDIMPLLRELNPRADAALARTADILRSDNDLFDTLANDAGRRFVRTIGDGRVAIDADGLAGLPKALARRVALAALETVNPGQSYGLAEADHICAAGRHPVKGCPTNLPGVDVERLGADVVLVKRGSAEGGSSAFASSASADKKDPPLHLRLTVPGTVEEPRGGWTLTAEGPMYRQMAGTLGADQVVVDAGDLGSGLIVRQRRPGDRLHPLGAPGSKKVQDVFVDRKVPRDDRDRVPIVTDEMGRIVWVAGQVLAEPFRVTPLTTTVVILTLRRK